MRTSTAYFAGVGTVVAAIVGGVGGGLLIADMIHPKAPKQGTEVSRLERLRSPEPIQAAAGPSEPVQYLNTPQLPGSNAAVAPVTPQPQPEVANASPAPAQPAAAAAPQPAAMVAQPAAAAQPAATVAQPAAPAVQPPAASPAPQVVAREQAGAPEDALARARDADVKRAVEKRKIERRQQWAERRRQRQQQESRTVEIVRDDGEPRREVVVQQRRELVAEPARTEMPLIRLFGSD